MVLLVATPQSWSLLSADVSEAFLRGITFEQLHQLDKSQPLRIVEIPLPPGTEQLVQALPGMEGYNPFTPNAWALLKPGFGLKDAPSLVESCENHQVLDQGGPKPTQTHKAVVRQVFQPAIGSYSCHVHVDDLKLEQVF